MKKQSKIITGEATLEIEGLDKDFVYKLKNGIEVTIDDPPAKGTCNQCLKKCFYIAINQETVNLITCFNPKCPNFALLQVAAEDIPSSPPSP